METAGGTIVTAPAPTGHPDLREDEQGIVTPAAVVATANLKDEISLSVARKQLDLMVKQGDVEIRATSSGEPPLVYVVPEFLTETSRASSLRGSDALLDKPNPPPVASCLWRRRRIIIHV